MPACLPACLATRSLAGRQLLLSSQLACSAHHPASCASVLCLPLLLSGWPCSHPAACDACKPACSALQAHKKAIRRATVNTFGYIAKAIGPQDVLVTLLNNLKVQERQNRVCTTVAIAIVAETCSPFTVLPALMNEYKVSTCTAKGLHNAGC